MKHVFLVLVAAAIVVFIFNHIGDNPKPQSTTNQQSTTTRVEKTHTQAEIDTAYARCLQSYEVQVNAMVSDYETNRRMLPIGTDTTYYVSNILKPNIAHIREQGLNNCYKDPFSVSVGVVYR